MSSKKSRLEIARKQALIKSVDRKTEKRGIGIYDQTDYLKHYIRKNFWEKRILNLKRDIAPKLDNGIRYFSFCSKYAFDVRYFIKKGYIDPAKENSKFGFVEFVKDDYDFLNTWLTNNPTLKEISDPIQGLLADVATDSAHKHYGKFWSAFPYDVINLDYLGDILRISNPTGKIGQNDFFAIDAIIARQSLLRRPYELWITVRAKSGRFEGVVKQAFRGIIKKNLDDYPDTFGKKYNKLFNGTKINNIDDEELFLIGYLKWLWFSCNRSFSVLNKQKIQVIKYKRNSQKDGEEYYLYNILLRVEPFENFVFPSPAGDAADYCRDEYINGITECFCKPIDISVKYEELASNSLNEIKNELSDLYKGYKDLELGWA
jgi:hypothetical protein